MKSLNPNRNKPGFEFPQHSFALSDERFASYWSQRADDSVMMFLTYESALSAAVAVGVLVVDDTVGKRQSLSKRHQVEMAIKINPLSAVVRPRLSAECLGDSQLLQFSFKPLEMFANHRSTFTL